MIDTVLAQRLRANLCNLPLVIALLAVVAVIVVVVV